MGQRFFWKSLQSAIDVVSTVIAFVAAYAIRFEGALPRDVVHQMVLVAPYLLGARLVCQHMAGIYRIEWRYVGLRDVRNFALGLLPPSAILLVFRLGLSDRYALGRVPLSIIALELFISFAAVFGARVLRRMVFEWRQARRRGVGNGAAKPILLVGAGQAGVVIAREIESRPNLGLRLVGFVDDDAQKRGQTVHGVPVLGGTADLPELVREHAIDHVVITIASASGADMRRIIGVCESVPVRAQIVPGIYELVDGTVSVNRLRDVQVEDLLGRAPVNLDMNAIGRFLRGKQVLVTGAGGSIGSEMCRQICRFDPQALILVERAENNLFDIERELRAAHPELTIAPCLADICDGARMDAVFETYLPQVVVHAAAHKHVPLMEANPGEAVKNNVFGTRRVAELADRHKAEVFVMISTDKAVNPTSVMGASKRVAEMFVQSCAQRSRTRFITVRFGNVLGSVGSVVPIFKEQIKRGGPVTVTHPEMKRYFMTIPEASQLVLQAASMGEGGEIYVLDMGESVRILTLAEDLIRFSGLRPHDDIPIVFTGVRPGEKLFEELALSDEDVSKTRHPKIYVGRHRPRSAGEVDTLLGELAEVVQVTDAPRIRASLLKSTRETAAVLSIVKGAG